ncbi:MAG: Gfo/Idh/MocA family oxidoreductase [Victivallaceae bacterium]|nr:Gfo/Idh/MocA family oxidoreductase [Victivallaceae bacterium]
MFKLAVIGLDTSHSIKFTELIQGPDKKVNQLQVINCMRFPTPFQTEPDQDGRQQTLEDLGVKVTRDFNEAVEGVDGILLEINDPQFHLEYFEKIAPLGLPVFIDKPLADNLANGKTICDLAQKHNIKVWSASSLRFTPEICNCVKEIGTADFANVYGPLGKAASGSSLVWYGVHTFEMLITIMGSGAKTITAREDAGGITAIVNYDEHRRGVVECNSNAYYYGGRGQNKDDVNSFTVNFANAGELYSNLILALERFFIDGVISVALSETLEIQAMMEATEKSLTSGKTEPVKVD